MSPTHSRYHGAAIALHWLMALALLFMFASGLYMVNADISKAQQYQWFQWHKSAGVLVLWAVTLRLLLRWRLKAPPLPDGFSAAEQHAAHWGHRALYAAMLLMPITGWLMVSASAFGLPTIVFGWFEWPHIPWVSRDKTIETLARTSHEWIAFAFIALIAVHAAAVWKHHRDGIALLSRMRWRKYEN